MFARSLLASVVGLAITVGAANAALADPAPMVHRAHAMDVRVHRPDAVKVVHTRVVRNGHGRIVKTRTVVVRRHHTEGLAKVRFAHRTAHIAHRIG